MARNCNQSHNGLSTEYIILVVGSSSNNTAGGSKLLTSKRHLQHFQPHSILTTHSDSLIYTGNSSQDKQPCKRGGVGVPDCGRGHHILSTTNPVRSSKNDVGRACGSVHCNHGEPRCLVVRPCPRLALIHSKLAF